MKFFNFISSNESESILSKKNAKAIFDDFTRRNTSLELDGDRKNRIIGLRWEHLRKKDDLNDFISSEFKGFLNDLIDSSEDDISYLNSLRDPLHISNQKDFQKKLLILNDFIHEFVRNFKKIEDLEKTSQMNKVLSIWYEFNKINVKEFSLKSLPHFYESFTDFLGLMLFIYKST